MTGSQNGRTEEDRQTDLLKVSTRLKCRKSKLDSATSCFTRAHTANSARDQSASSRLCGRVGHHILPPSPSLTLFTTPPVAIASRNFGRRAKEGDLTSFWGPDCAMLIVRSGQFRSVVAHDARGREIAPAPRSRSAGRDGAAHRNLFA